MTEDNATLVGRLRDEASERAWRLADLLEEAADRIELLETQIENAKSARHLFKQPSIVGTSTAGSWTTSQTPGDAQPKNGETK